MQARTSLVPERAGAISLDLDEELLGPSKPPQHPITPVAAVDCSGGGGGGDGMDPKERSALEQLKLFNAQAAKHPYVRRGKTVVFFAMALYGFVTTLIEFAGTFQKHPEFSSEVSEERCVPRFYQAVEFANAHPAAMVGFWVGAGTSRIAVCANATDAELDTEFGDLDLFDPLALITPGGCSLDSPPDVAAAIRGCVVTGDGPAVSREAGCAAAFATAPAPRGVGWSYILQEMPKNPPQANIIHNGTSSPAGNGTTTLTTTTAAPSAPGNGTHDGVGGRCGALAERNGDMPACPYTNVRFYERKNPFLALLYIFTAFWSVIMILFEFYMLREFTNDKGPHFGDLTYMIAPFDGSAGAFYSLYRFLRRRPELSELPDPSWLQFLRSGFTSVLGFGVSTTAMYGCAVTWNIKMFVLLLLSVLKFAYDAAAYLRGRLCPDMKFRFGAPKEPMSPGRHERNDTPMADDDKLGTLLYKHARAVVVGAEGGKWPALLHQFAISNAAQRRLMLSQWSPGLPRTDGKKVAPAALVAMGHGPTAAAAMAAKRGPLWDYEESDAYVLEQLRVVLEHAVEAERPAPCWKQLLGCFFKTKTCAFPEWAAAERQRIHTIAANANLDAHLVRRRIVTRLVVVDTMLQALEGSAMVAAVGGAQPTASGGGPPPLLVNVTLQQHQHPQQQPLPFQQPTPPQAQHPQQQPQQCQAQSPNPSQQQWQQGQWQQQQWQQPAWNQPQYAPR